MLWPGGLVQGSPRAAVAAAALTAAVAVADADAGGNVDKGPHLKPSSIPGCRATGYARHLLLTMQPAVVTSVVTLS